MPGLDSPTHGSEDQWPRRSDALDGDAKRRRRTTSLSATRIGRLGKSGVGRRLVEMIEEFRAPLRLLDLEA